MPLPPSPFVVVASSVFAAALPSASAVLVCRQDSAEIEQSEHRAVQWRRQMQLFSALGPLRHTETVLNNTDDLEERPRKLQSIQHISAQAD